ncbi:MAG: bifunctional tetrahydrofolate synthase/dihydrofolate synthase [Pseudomonadota bacterium]
MVQPHDLASWLSHLEKLHPSTIELGLARVREVAQRLPLDFGKARVITVGGTNGKGSSVTMLASVLRTAGYQVATYTSPHIRIYNERVGLNDRLATDAELCAGFAAVEQARGDLSLTYFEFGTLAAFWLFAQIKPDFIILEVGLGGRLDAVNIIDANVSLLTNVDLDHIDWLGDTREKIGFEKAGIFRSGCPAVYGERSMPDSVRNFASEHAVPLSHQGEQFGWQQHGDRWHWFGEDCEGKAIEMNDLPLNGFPLDNAAAVLQVLQFLPISLSRTVIDEGLARAELAGRFQQLSYKGIRVILDVAHNPHAAANLAANIRTRLAGCDVRLVLGMLGDKDSSGVVRLLSPEVAHIYAASLGGERGAPADILYNHARQLGYTAISCHATVDAAFAAACSSAGQRPGMETVVVVTGSFFTISAVLELL